jgi:hypothetical protein
MAKKIKTKCRFRSPWRFEMVIGPQHTGNSNYGFCHVLLRLLVWHYYFGPVRPTFTTYQFFCDLSQSLGLTDSFCITEFPLSSEHLHGGTGKCVYLGLSSCRIYFKFSLYFMEIWKFISPALYKERKNARHSSFSSLLFFYWSAVWLLYCNSHVS